MISAPISVLVWLEIVAILLMNDVALLVRMAMNVSRSTEKPPVPTQ